MTDNRVKTRIDRSLSGLQVGEGEMNRLFRLAEGGQKMKRKRPVALAAALILVLSAATAIALDAGGVLTYLFPRDQAARDKAAPYVQIIDVARRGGRASTRVRDALIKDGVLSVGLSVDSPQPVYVVTRSISIDGKAFDVSDSSIESQWIHEGDSPLRARGFSVDLSSVPDTRGEAWSLRLTAAILVPREGTETVDTEGENVATVWDEIDRIIAAGKTPVSLYEPHEVLVGSRWMRENQYDPTQGIQYPVGSAEDHAAFSNMEIADEIDLTFSIDPGIELRE